MVSYFFMNLFVSHRLLTKFHYLREWWLDISWNLSHEYILKAFYTGTSAAIKGSKVFFQTFTGCRQGGVKFPVIFNIYLDFVLRCVEHEVLQRFPNTGLQYSFLIYIYLDTALHVNNVAFTVSVVSSVSE